MGSFRSVYRIPDNLSLSEYEGDVFKFPIDGNPESRMANKLEMLFHNRETENIQKNLATAKY